MFKALAIVNDLETWMSCSMWRGSVQNVHRITASTAHAQGWLSTPLAREYVCQRCGKALPPLGIEPLPPAPKARALKDRAIWTLVINRSSSRDAGGLTSADRTGYTTATQRNVE